MTPVKSQKEVRVLPNLTRSLRCWLAVAIGIVFLGALAQVTILHAQTMDAPRAGPVKVPWYQFRWAVQDLESALQTNRQVPTVVWFGGEPYPPASYLFALAHVADGLLEGHQPQKAVTLAPASLDTTKYVAKNTHDTWDWPIFRPGLNGKHLLDLARLQTWTLKPAQLEEAPGPEANAPMETRQIKGVLSANTLGVRNRNALAKRAQKHLIRNL